MVTARLRDPDALRDGLDRWLAGEPSWGGAAVTEFSHASAGWSNETVLVTLADNRRLVLRLPPLVASFPEESLALEAEVLGALWNSAVPVPGPVTYVADERWLGCPFVVMAFVDGHVPGQAPAFDPWVTEGPDGPRARLYQGFLSTMAGIHRLDWQSLGLGGALRGAENANSLEVDLQWWSHYLEWSFGDEPFGPLAEAFAWCVERRPEGPPGPPALLWGDPRLGNLVVDQERRVRAVLDWEMATIGPPESDLAWALALEWSTAELTGHSVPGFPSHDEAVSDYEKLLGRKVVDLWWFEVFALVRSLAISNHQARAARAAGVRYTMGADELNPMVGLVAKRIAMTAR